MEFMIDLLKIFANSWNIFRNVGAPIIFPMWESTRPYFSWESHQSAPGMFLTNYYAFLSNKRPNISQNCKYIPPKSKISLQVAKLPLYEITKFSIVSRYGQSTGVKSLGLMVLRKICKQYKFTITKCNTSTLNSLFLFRIKQQWSHTSMLINQCMKGMYNI